MATLEWNYSINKVINSLDESNSKPDPPEELVK